MTLNKNTAKKYPLNSLKTLGDILKKLREIVSDYRTIISEETNNENEIVKFFDRQNPDFYFKTTYESNDYSYAGNNSKYEIIASYYPGDEDSHNHGKLITNEILVTDLLRAWI
jgi:hypothetical protein